MFKKIAVGVRVKAPHLNPFPREPVRGEGSWNIFAMINSFCSRSLTFLLLCLVVPDSRADAQQDEERSAPSAAVADAPPQPASSSDLSTALPPEQWLQVQRSIDRGLAWLAAQQRPDGRFPSAPAGQPAVTALGVMAFLSRGHLPGQGPYGENIERAIDFVLDTQSRRGYFSLLQVPPSSDHLGPGQTLLYNHCIAGLMLGEVYGMTGGERGRRIGEAIPKALAFSRGVQTRGKATEPEIGGWRYAYPDSPRANSDLSVTGWALMFYRSARNAEFIVPKSYVDEGLDFVERCYVDRPSERTDGVYRYRPLETAADGRVSLANTGSATLALLLGGRHDSDQVSEAVAWYLGRPYPAADRAGYFYLSAYYNSQAFAQVGGDAWNRIYPQIAEAMLGHQSSDGSWPPGRGNETSFGSTYATALAVLSLTPAYQLLPIYQR
jgi:hypothetical protein